MRTFMRFLSCLLLAGVLLGFSAHHAWAMPQEHEKEEGEGDSSVGKPKIEMKPFNFSLLKRGKVTGKVTLNLVLVIEEDGAHEKVRTRLPQLRSDFNSALTVLARQRFSVSRPINPDIVKAYLTPYADRRLGHGLISIYVKQALIEPE